MSVQKALVLRCNLEKSQVENLQEFEAKIVRMYKVGKFGAGRPGFPA